MNGHIRPRSPGVWQFRAELPKIDGRRRQKTRLFKGSETAARQAFRAWLREIETSETASPAESSGQTLAAYLAQWITLHLVTSVRGSTMRTYRRICRNWIAPHIGHVRLTDLRAIHVTEMLTGLRAQGLSARTQHHAYTVLRNALEQAVRWELLPRNPVRLIQAPRVDQQEMLATSLQELQAVLAATRGSRLYVVAILALGAGLRRGEICALTWADVDFKHRVVRVQASIEHQDSGYVRAEPKTRSSRRAVAVSDELLAVLSQHRADQRLQAMELGHADPPWLLSEPDGRMTRPDILSQRWSRVMRKAGINVTLQRLRHDHISHLLSRSAPVRHVSARVGHSRSTTTLSVYAHLINDGADPASSAAGELLSDLLNGGTTPKRRNVGGKMEA